MSESSLHRGAPAWLLALWLTIGGCSFTEFAVDTAAGMFSGSTDGLRKFFDYETAGHAAANSVLQFEALHSASPDNEELTLMLVQVYMAYTFGWVMEDFERANFAAELEEADRHQHRAFLLYTRARDLALRTLRVRDEAIDEVIHHPDKLTAYLKEEYDDPEDDLAPVFWLATAWGSMVLNAPGSDELIDLPSVRALAEHVTRLDPGYEGAAALTLLGGVEAAYPEALGGNLAKGKAYFERALKLSGRKDHLVHFNYARTYGINAQDKALYVALLKEVIEAPDQGNRVRMSNKVARRRAELYLAHIEEFFD